LVAAGGPVGIVGDKALLGKDVKPREQTEGFVAVEVVDVRAPFFVEEFEGQEAQQRRRCWDHARARIVRLPDQGVEAEPCEQGHKEEDAGDPRAETATGSKVELLAIGDGGRVGLGWRQDGVAVCRSTAGGLREKGGG
jgi:hypothetical protein